MRALMWLVALYLLLDLCDAGLPGAFTFDPDTSVEVVHAARPDAPDHPLRDASVEPTCHVVLVEDPAPPSPHAIVAPVTARSSMLALRPPRTQLAPEDGPAASAAA